MMRVTWRCDPQQRPTAASSSKAIRLACLAFQLPAACTAHLTGRTITPGMHCRGNSSAAMSRTRFQVKRHEGSEDEFRGESLALRKFSGTETKPFPFEPREESWERFGKDNCRIWSICVRPGAAKDRANQLHIDLVLDSGTISNDVGRSAPPNSR